MRLWEEENAAIRAGKRQVVDIKGVKRNVRPSVRRIGQKPPVSKPVTVPKNVWKPLSMADGGGKGSRMGRNERWIESNQDGDIGVEVACTLPPSPTGGSAPNKKGLSLRRLSGPPILQVGNNESASSSKGASKMKKRLLKSISSSAIAAAATS